MAESNGILTEAVYYILLSVFTPLHGYGIMQKVEKMSNGRVVLGAGTLYGAINTLLKKGLIAEIAQNEPSRKKEYLITDSGIQAVKNEIIRLEELAQNGHIIIGGNDNG